MHNELLELYVIFQAKVLHMRDASGWRHVFDKSVQRLLSIQPLQSITKVDAFFCSEHMTAAPDSASKLRRHFAQDVLYDVIRVDLPPL